MMLLSSFRNHPGALLEDSHENAGATNDQAAAVAEVVATMEDSNRLSRHMGELADEVKRHSVENLDKVGHGKQTLESYLSLPCRS